MESIREELRAEGRRRRGETWDDERRVKRAAATAGRNRSGELRASPQAIGEGLRRYYAEHPEAVDRERLREIAKRPRRPRQVVCEGCGASFASACNRARWCPDCRPAAEREHKRRWRARQRAKARRRASEQVERRE